MKETKSQDLRTKSEDELKKQLLDLRREQLNLRLQKANQQTVSLAPLRHARKTIAKIKTILNEKQKPAKPLAAVPKKSAKPKAKKA